MTAILPIYYLISEFFVPNIRGTGRILEVKVAYPPPGRIFGVSAAGELASRRDCNYRRRLTSTAPRPRRESRAREGSGMILEKLHPDPTAVADRKMEFAVESDLLQQAAAASRIVLHDQEDTGLPERTLKR